MKAKTAKTNLVNEYLNGYILVGGFWSPRHCWINIWDGNGVPKQHQNHMLCGDAYTREEIEKAGVWAVHSIEEIKAVCGEYL